jgi:hypothetical protein
MLGRYHCSLAAFAFAFLESRESGAVPVGVGDTMMPEK